jgi:hypothetical protein
MSVGAADERLEGARPTVMTEAELAAMRADDGTTVVVHDGRYWNAIFPGFYQPIHLLARFQAAEVKRPSFLCWGYRASLRDEDTHLATGSVPVHMLTRVGQFTEARLNRNRRRDLRECRQRVEFRRVREPSLLVDQGYAVFTSANHRLAYWRPLTPDAYRGRMERRAPDERRFILAGLVDGKLAGYLESYAVDGVLYTSELLVASEALDTGISTGLYVETIQACARGGTIHAVCGGLHTPERPTLCAYKEGLGFRIVHVPARIVMPGPIGAYIRARRPAVYYRLVGVKQPPVASPEE